MNTQCKAKTKRGQRCPNAASDTGFCFTHDPARQIERKAARKLGGLRRRRGSVSGGPVVIKTTADILTLINSVIADVTNLDNSPARARVLLQAASAASTALEISEMDARLAAIERALNIRGNEVTSGP